ncbi:DUF192 domain-containing protein [Mesorhizobium sp. GbtcB19]|uniref:DUF192 domain-containing protein n=1 Tax=Mesorhizobium sp. GbtcB19 TaxID=2824764 RepID=UPI001C2FFCF0|nr:DUF192 domain-containing protein [Mesorhizobium sp. GbtcB19]
MTHRGWLVGGTICTALTLMGYLSLPGRVNGQPMMLPVDLTPLVVETSSGERSFFVEIADTSKERQAGLMYRQSMDDNHGMLFVFNRSGEVSFWMKNTPMALDLVFVGQDHRIRSIKQGEPESVSLISPGQPVSFVLELKAGTAARDGLENGDVLRHPAIFGPDSSTY